MAKVRDQFVDRRPVERRVWSVKKIAVLALLGFVLVPFLIEGVAVSVVQWAEVNGTRLVFKTPLLDWSGSKLEYCRQLVEEWMAYNFRDASWEPGFVLPITVVLIVIAMLMLRR